MVKTQPMYPLSAKDAENLRYRRSPGQNRKGRPDQGSTACVQGPLELQDAAMDAVKQWVYQPYVLYDEPVEVETTINVIFTLGGRP